MLLPLEMRDWLPHDHMVHFILDMVEAANTSGFSINQRGTGSKQYPPSMLLALLVHCYCTGRLSSRVIESRHAEKLKEQKQEYQRKLAARETKRAAKKKPQNSARNHSRNSHRRIAAREGDSPRAHGSQTQQPRGRRTLFPAQTNRRICFRNHYTRHALSSVPDARQGGCHWRVEVSLHCIQFEKNLQPDQSSSSHRFIPRYGPKRVKGPLRRIISTYALKRSPKSRKVNCKRYTRDTTPEEGELATGLKKR